MKNKFKLILGLACSSILCAGAAACNSRTQLEEYRANGYVISVTYDANGGSFLNRPGVTLMDLFKPSDFEKGADGKVHIPLIEPTDEARKTSNLDKISLVMQGHFFAGWYENRELRKNDAGNVIDTHGVELTEKADGTFIYADTQQEAFPAYTYSEYWNFEEDTIDYAESDGVVEMTLYAAWVPLYQFNYYYQVEGASDWTLLQSTTFDYKLTHAEGSTTFDRDTIWTPDWKDGKMNHQYRYADNEIYTFPEIEGKTFVAAYTDSDKKQPINGSLKHHGTLDMETGIAQNNVQDIYIVVEEGMHYRIETAKQLCDNASTDGIYELVADLDFYDAETQTQLLWPAIFEGSTFQGKFYSTEDKTFKIKNVVAEHTSESIEIGGLFGKVAKDAVIKNVAFENATLDLVLTQARMREGYFGLFAGFVETGASVENVTISGMIRIGNIQWESDVCSLNLVTNGQNTGITKGEVKLQIYGVDTWVEENTYYYTIDPAKVTVDENGDVKMTYEYGLIFNYEYKDINY